MRTNTNWEDNQLMADAAEKQLRIQKRARGIENAVTRGLHKILTELMDDYNLTNDEAVAHIKRQL
jgi:hypothetical protein